MVAPNHEPPVIGYLSSVREGREFPLVGYLAVDRRGRPVEFVRNQPPKEGKDFDAITRLLYGPTLPECVEEAAAEAVVKKAQTHRSWYSQTRNGDGRRTLYVSWTGSPSEFLAPLVGPV